ncbi:hypothetical protein [Actinomarinicola tropica]|uniref:Uncharacterized protein n=1 Tax=Actinomarinicola tropica TaxID=2789776 RepID=A0A5Q2RLI6_9ACTN|nr:hypothetical protein [Actinomarinicola tropica]QGG94720.1 hypothetical protein GH723_06135 [Actinomarinicola tropica]
MTPRDTDRQRVEDAEIAAFGGTDLEEERSWDEVTSILHAVVLTPWWTQLEVPAPVLRPARADARRSSADGRTIRICRGGRTAYTVAHELAHHLVVHLPPGGPGHGPAFRAAALRTVAVVGGTEARDVLAEEWRRWGVPPGSWHRSEPPPGPGLALGGVIAL